MNLFSKRLLTWKEPEAFRLSEDRRSAVNNKWWLRPLGLFAFVAMFMLSWEIAKLTPGKHPPDFIVAFPMSVGFGCLLLYLYPWWLRRCPGTVSLYSKGIIKMGEKSIRLFKQISGYNWSEEGSYYVLRLMNKKGRAFLYGVPDPILREKIETVLRQNGLQERSPR
jgi:hypothetical protein